MTDTALTPKALADELSIDPKTLRGYLRKHAARPIEAKNTSWTIDADAANAAREHFAAKSRLTVDQALAEAYSA